MNAIILSIGDELALGQTVDTNSAYLAQQLSAIGCDVLAHKTVADDRAAIARTIAEEAPRCDVLLITGGLGPTEDDLTRDAIADVLGVPLIENQSWIDELQKFFAKLGRPMPDRNRVQALIPDGSTMLFNQHGTAPGIQALHKTDSHECVIFATPGVPKEMKPMFERFIKPFVSEKAGGAVILQKTLHTFGAGESTIADKLGSLMMRQRNPSVGTTVSGGIVSLRVNARFASLAEARRQIDQTIADCRTALGELIFGEDGQTLAEVVCGQLRDAGVTVATAESCTGGLLAKMLTDYAGSSAYFGQGWVTYSDASKTRELAVRESTLAQHGAVSEPVVIEMASGARERSGSDVAFSISGIAGPDGGTEAKPVGTVCIGFAHAGGTCARTFRFPGDRDFIRDRSAKMALTMLRYHLLGKPMPF